MNNNNTRKNSNSNRSNSNISLEEMTLGKLIMELKKNDEFRKNVKSMFENTNSPLHQDLDNLRNEVNELKNQVAQLREELNNKQVGGDLAVPVSGNLNGTIGQNNSTLNGSALSTPQTPTQQTTDFPTPGPVGEQGGDLVNGFSQENNEFPSPSPQPPLNSTNSVLSADNTLTIPQTPVSPITGNQSPQPELQTPGFSPDNSSPMELSPIPSGNQSPPKQLQTPELNDSQEPPVARQLNFNQEEQQLPTFSMPPPGSEPTQPLINPGLPNQLAQPPSNKTGGQKRKAQPKKKRVVARTVKPAKKAKEVKPKKQTKKQTKSKPKA